MPVLINPLNIVTSSDLYGHVLSTSRGCRCLHFATDPSLKHYLPFATSDPLYRCCPPPPNPPSLPTDQLLKYTTLTWSRRQLPQKQVPRPQKVVAVLSLLQTPFLRCRLSPLLKAKPQEQCGHLWTLTLLCMFWWSSKWSFTVKPLSQTSHLYRNLFRWKWLTCLFSPWRVVRIALQYWQCSAVFGGTSSWPEKEAVVRVRVASCLCNEDCGVPGSDGWRVLGEPWWPWVLSAAP